VILASTPLLTETEEVVKLIGIEGHAAGLVVKK